MHSSVMPVAQVKMPDNKQNKCYFKHTRAGCLVYFPGFGAVLLISGTLKSIVMDQRTTFSRLWFIFGLLPKIK